MSVKTPRTEYSEMLPTWKRIDDCVAGETAIKREGYTYLPQLNPADTSPNNVARNNSYRERAVFYNFTRRTLNGLQSLAFNEAPSFELGAVDYLEFDVDGAGISLTQQVKRTLIGVLAKGRRGLLVDFPTTDGPVTRAQVMAGVRAGIQTYRPENIINWRTQKIGQIRKLSLVVLQESYDAGDNEFVVTPKVQYRVLRLVDGIYQQQVYRDGEPGEVLQPRLGNGQLLDFIPFVFPGSVNNDDEIDSPPLEDIASLNVAHYRNSADYEDSLNALQPTLMIYTDMDSDTFKAHNPAGIQMGSRTGHVLGQADRAEILTVPETNAHAAAMEQKEKQAVQLGAKIIEPNGAAKTAFQARSESASETSLLKDITQNVSAAYTQCIRWVAMFMNVNPEPLFYELSDDFGIDELTVEERAQLVAEWQSGIIPKRVVRDRLREAAIIEPGDENTDEALDAEIETGLDLNG